MKFLNPIFFTILFTLASATSAMAQTAPATRAITAVEKIQEATPTKTVTTKVKGVTCNDDVKSITNSVKKIKGITSCTAAKKGPTTTFEITYNPSLTTLEDIHKAIENTSGCKDPNDRPYKVKE